MPPSAAIDTHAYYKRLTAAGMEPGVAEVIAQESAHRLENLATKEDINLLQKDIEMLRKDLTIKLGGLMMVMTGIIIGAIKLLS